MKPGEEIWSLIPGNKDATVLLYEDDKLIKTEVFDSWQNVTTQVQSSGVQGSKLESDED